MYLRGSKLNMMRKRKRIHPFRIAVLLVLIGAAVYVNQVVVPQTPPLFLPTPTATRNPASYITDAETYFTAGKLTKSIESYKQAIQADPNNISNFISLARLQIYTNDYQNALANAENALLLAPNNAQALSYRGWAQYFLGNYLDAEGSLKSALEVEPSNPLAHAFYAELLGRQAMTEDGSFDEAISESRKAIDLGPNLLETHRARGYILEWTSNYEEAIKEFQAAIAINKNIADLHLELGANYANMGELGLAEEEYNKAIPLNPTNPLPKLYLAKAYGKEGEYPKAVQFAEQALKDAPTDASIYGYLGIYYRKVQQPGKAVQVLQMAVQGGLTDDGKEVKGLPLSNDLDVLRIYSAYMLALAETNRCTEAVEVSQALMKVFPDDEITKDNIAYMTDVCKQNIIGTYTSTPRKADETPVP